MPFLRVIRDKRGYETTYLMHWVREGNRQNSRILYVFRTPAGMRVGREALEPDVLKLIEAHHPDIEFDWNAVFHNQQVVEPSTEPRRPRKRLAAEAPVEAPPAPQQQQPPRPSIPSKIEGATPDEQVAFLTRWHDVIRERIPQRVADPARQEVLLLLAERLNCATWTDADQITAGLQQASEALERLSHVFGRRRRAKKRSGADAPRTAPSSPSADGAGGVLARPDEAEDEVGPDPLENDASDGTGDPSDPTDDSSDSVPDE